MKNLKKQVSDYKKIAKFLNMRCFRIYSNSYADSIEKVDKRLKKENKTFSEIMKEIHLQEKEEEKQQKAIEKEEKKREAKIEAQKKVALQFKKNNDFGRIPAKVKEYDRPFCFNKSAFLRGSYRGNSGAGDFYVELRLGDKFDARTQIEKDWNAYSKSCKFPANDYSTFITLPKNGYFQLVGGLWTWIEKLDRHGSKAAWIEQKVLTAYPVYGYLINGYHVEAEHARNLKEARAYVLSIRLKQRAKELRLTRKTYTLADSLHAGNCRAGSLAFANVHNIDPAGTYTGKFLLEIATPNELPFVKRFVK